MAGAPQGVLGTNSGPVSFPGISSGIDYNSIIQKLTSIQLSQTQVYNNQIVGLTSANTELIKINSLFMSVQNALGALSNPSVFQAVSAASSNPSILTANQTPNVAATPGTYTILQTRLATATSITSSTTYGHTENDFIAGTRARDVALSQSYAQITPSNGDPTKGSGSVTIDGVKVAYDVTTQSLDTILANITNAVRTAPGGDAQFLATLAAGTDQVVFSSSDQPISLGNTSDNGNLLQVLKLDQAQLVNTGTSGLITAVAGVGGVNQVLSFNSTNGPGNAATNGNYITAVTAGTFTLNGVQISVNSTDATVDVINKINSSAAGVIAAFNQETGQITLTNKNSGPQSIVLGGPFDTSNFLQAAGLTGPGSTTTLGTQASVTVQNGGGSSTIYSNSNTVTTAIPGISLNLLASSSTPTTVTVAQDSTQIVSAINAFISAYNAAINEINVATAPPQVLSSQPGTNSTSQHVGGGVLWNNSDVSMIKDELTNLVSSFVGATGYNSWSTIGIQLDNSFQQLTVNQNAPSSQGPISTQTLGGTDGALQALDVTKFQAALAANPTQVENLFVGSTSIVNQLGFYLTGVTGQPTLLNNGLDGTAPPVSQIQAFENSNTDQISSLQQQVQLITDSANAYANMLRQEFSASEQQIAGYQSLQSQLSGFFKNG